MDWFKGKLEPESPINLTVKTCKTMVSGSNFPLNQSIELWLSTHRINQ